MADKGSNMKNINLMVAVVASGVVFGGLGFWGGKIYNANRIDDDFQGRAMYNQDRPGMTNNRNLNSGNGKSGSTNGMVRGGGMIIGEVSSVDGDSINIALADGSSKIILLGSDTTYTISNQSSKDKLTIGTKVAVMGETTSDGSGSTKATSIEINPALRGQANSAN